MTHPQKTNTQSIDETKYSEWLDSIKNEIKNTSIKIAVASNIQMIQGYWEIGKNVSCKLAVEKWGSSIIERLSVDLRAEFPNKKGLSARNIYAMKQFYEFYSQQFTISPQSVAKLPFMMIPWGHQRIILQKSKDLNEALFYNIKVLENGWKRDTLELQIKHELYKKSFETLPNNFSKSLGETSAKLVEQVVKDPYWFDFVEIEEEAHERDIEQQMVSNITKVLLEMGKGFAFVGQQYHITLNEKDYYIDLLFYHIILKRYVVVELKNQKFQPEFVGKLNFYLNVVDRQLKNHDDNPSIGLLLCRDKDSFEVEYALQGVEKPIGVSQFNVTELQLNNIKSQLPTVTELEQHLNSL